MSAHGYRRILLKLSGEVLMGDQAYGIDPVTVARVAEEVSAGRQAFVVCPRIDETDAEPESPEGFVDDTDASAEDLVELTTPTQPKAPLAAALSVAEGLKLNPALAGVTIDVLHGRMSSEQKALI